MSDTDRGASMRRALMKRIKKTGDIPKPLGAYEREEIAMGHIPPSMPDAYKYKFMETFDGGLNEVLPLLSEAELRFAEAYAEKPKSFAHAYAVAYPKAVQGLSAGERKRAGMKEYRKTWVKTATEFMMRHTRVLTETEVRVQISDLALMDISNLFSYDASGHSYLDLEKIVEQGKTHLIRSIQYDKTGRPHVQLFDRFEALKQLSHEFREDRKQEQALTVAGGEEPALRAIYEKMGIQLNLQINNAGPDKGP